MVFATATATVYSRRAAKSAVGRVGRKKTGGRGRIGGGDYDSDDHYDGGGGLSIDNLAQLRGGLGGERRLPGRRSEWDGVPERGSNSGDRRDGSLSSSRLPPPPAQQGYDGNPWEEEDSD